MARLDLRAAVRLVFIVDDKGAREGDRMDAVLGGGVTCMWLRAPGATGSELYHLARDLRVRCDAHEAALVVGDRADVAAAAEADGVQLGYRSPPLARIRPHFSGWIGASCHSARELDRAERDGADFAVLSPVFGVPEKGPALGTARFHKLREACGLPVVGLGGIEIGNVAEVRAAGADGVAVIRALRDAPDPAAGARSLVGA